MQDDPVPVPDFFNEDKPSVAALFVLFICLVSGSVLFLLFLRLKTKFPKIYRPRLLLSLKGIDHASLWQFLKSFPWFFTFDEDVFLYEGGIDTFVHLRTLCLCLVASLFIGVPCCVVVIPVNLQGNLNLTDPLNRASMSGVPSRSSLLWVHAIVMWVSTALLLSLLWNEWSVQIRFKEKYCQTFPKTSVALLIRDIPVHLREPYNLRQKLLSMFHTEDFTVHVFSNMSSLLKKLRKHDLKVQKIGPASSGLAQGRLNGTDGEYSISEQYLELLNESLKYHSTINCAIVVFKSAFTAATAVQSEWHTNPRTFNVSRTYSASSLIWSNIGLPKEDRDLRSTFMFILIGLLILFWAIPITFVASLTKVEVIAAQLDKIDAFNKTLGWIMLNLLQGLLPVLLIRLFYLYLPTIVNHITMAHGFPTRVEAHTSTYRWLYIFYMLNTFLVFIVSGSVIQNITGMVKEPLEIPKLLASSLPSQSSFFIAYFIAMALVALPWELLQGSRLFWYIISQCTKSSLRKLLAWTPPHPEFPAVLAQDSLIFTVGLCYSVLSPAIVPFWCLYFGIALCIWKRQYSRVYVSQFCYMGLFWPKIFDSLVSGLVIYQLLMTGVFTLKLQFSVLAMVIPLPVLTVAISHYINLNYYNKYVQISLECARVITPLTSEEIEAIKEPYILDRKVPAQDELSEISLPSYMKHYRNALRDGNSSS